MRPPSYDQLLDAIASGSSPHLRDKVTPKPESLHPPRPPTQDSRLQTPDHRPQTPDPRPQTQDSRPGMPNHARVAGPSERNGILKILLDSLNLSHETSNPKTANNRIHDASASGKGCRADRGLAQAVFTQADIFGEARGGAKGFESPALDVASLKWGHRPSFLAIHACGTATDRCLEIAVVCVPTIQYSALLCSTLLCSCRVHRPTSLPLFLHFSLDRETGTSRDSRCNALLLHGHRSAGTLSHNPCSALLPQSLLNSLNIFLTRFLEDLDPQAL